MSRLITPWGIIYCRSTIYTGPPRPPSPEEVLAKKLADEALLAAFTKINAIRNREPETVPNKVGVSQ
jgi:hypothetical protein